MPVKNLLLNSSLSESLGKTDKEIYELWLSKVHDNRYLRPARWEGLKKVILKHKVRSILEFGCGVSTLLFSNMGIKVLTFETDSVYMDFVKGFNLPNVTFQLSNNMDFEILGHFDLAFIDGALPRLPQLKAALPLAKIIAIDDFGPRHKTDREFANLLAKHTRIDVDIPLMAIFRSFLILNGLWNLTFRILREGALITRIPGSGV